MSGADSQRFGGFHSSSAVAILLIGSALFTSACQQADCKKYAAWGLIVNVADARGHTICDATVTATAGDYSEELVEIDPVEHGGSCKYHGALERKGTYSIIVRKSGASTTLDGLKVTADSCHVRPVTTTISLSE